MKPQAILLALLPIAFAAPAAKPAKRAENAPDGHGAWAKDYNADKVARDGEGTDGFGVWSYQGDKVERDEAETDGYGIVRHKANKIKRDGEETDGFGVWSDSDKTKRDGDETDGFGVWSYQGDKVERREKVPDGFSLYNEDLNEGE